MYIKIISDRLKQNSDLDIAITILAVLALVVLVIQFRHPLALNMDGGYNASNVKALMEFRSMPYPGISIIPFMSSAVFGLIFGSAMAGIKIVTAVCIVAIGWFIYKLLYKVTNDNIPSFAGLIGWCISLGPFLYPLGYLKQTVALVFMVYGLICLYWIYESIDVRKNMIFWFICLFCILFSHQASTIIFLMSSFLISAIMLSDSQYRYGRVVSIALWSIMGLAIMLTPWIIPFLSQWFVQLSLDGYKTMIISIKGLFSHRYQLQVDFSGFDYLHVGIAFFGLAWSIGKWRKLALWLIGFGIVIFFVSLYACEYEWQMRNILTMFVPLSMCVGLGFYHLAKLTAKKSLYVAPVAITMALIVFALSGYGDTIIKTTALARPIISTEQLVDLNELLSKSDLETHDNIFARHGLRYWVTYTTDEYCGVLYRHWTDNYLAVRMSRGEESLPEGRPPQEGDYILISKTALFPWESYSIQENRLQAEIPSRASEYLRIEINSVDSFKHVDIILTSVDGDHKYTNSYSDITYGKNILGWLLSDVPRGTYDVHIVANDFETSSTSLYIEENLLEYSEDRWSILTESDEYLLMEVTP
jgi:hypothetical protein